VRHGPLTLDHVMTIDPCKVHRTADGHQDIPAHLIEARWHKEDEQRKKDGKQPIGPRPLRRSIVNKCERVRQCSSSLGFGRFGSTGWSPIKLLGNVDKLGKVRSTKMYPSLREREGPTAGRPRRQALRPDSCSLPAP
jgi:hypothetical protein